MDRRELAILKLGGSLITFKDQPLKANMKPVRLLGPVLSKMQGRLILVHGGGSYGHYFADKYGLSTEPRAVPLEGVSLTRSAMIELHLKVIKSLQRGGLNVYTVAASNFIDQSRISGDGESLLKSILSADLTPITFGDVLQSDGRFWVISGDRIVTLLAETFKPRRVVFALDVDGIYRSDVGRGDVIREIRHDEDVSFKSKILDVDVTGGIAAKVADAQRIAGLGVDVYLVNGSEPDRVEKALKGDEVYGTVIRRVKK